MRKTSTAVLGLAIVLGGCAARPDQPVDGAQAIEMDHLVFSTETYQVPVGGQVTFSNTSSRALHVLVVGKDAQPKAAPGAPSFGGASGHRAEVGDRWTTPAWNTPGTYWVTCTLHPSMNLKVLVSEY